ncbi:Rho guanine nucleotide exchange factor [Thalictrum thalictroides]|uniref:Rho guanine nucleotide exchange factor n=1 Tax=Thalictrum thalictroides TaxID=46969 RepID=A0A7J6X228_THATH|nr:Rho guanine nucleotide exchange factor [Thalictrum thalictroides]
MLFDKSTNLNPFLLSDQEKLIYLNSFLQALQPLEQQSTSSKGCNVLNNHIVKDTKNTIKPLPRLVPLPTSSSSQPTLNSNNMAFSVSTEELKSFHSIDRDLFTRLVIQLRCDVTQTMHVMALWLWLEEIGYPSIVLTLRSLPEDVVGFVFQEAITILNCIQSEIPPSSSSFHEIPRTYRFFQQEITLEFLYENRDYALNGINKMVSEVCNRAFDDINQQVTQIGRSQSISGNRGTAGYVGKPVTKKERSGTTSGQLKMPVIPFIQHGLYPGFQPLFHVQGFSPMEFLEETNAPMIPDISIPVPNIPQRFEIGESCNKRSLNPRAQSWFPTGVAPPEDRSMFMTFSRGYPITEEELRNYFNRGYGDVVQEIHMEQASANVQPLYAIVVFRSPATVAQILNGRSKVKFVVKGKHVWTRRFVPKH